MNSNRSRFWGVLMAGITLGSLTLWVLLTVSSLPEHRNLGRHLPEEIRVIKLAAPQEFRDKWIACEKASPCEDLHGACRLKHMRTCMLPPENLGAP